MVVISKKDVAKSPMPWSLRDVFWSKRTYEHVGNDFHVFHQHDGNVAAHLLTTTLGAWGAMQLAAEYIGIEAVYVYVALIVLTTPITTSVLHTALCYGCMLVTAEDVLPSLSSFGAPFELEAWHVYVFAIVAGFLLQDLAHYMAAEGTFMDSYMKQGKAWMLLVHTFWLLPLVIDAVVMRHFYLPFIVTRNRNIVCDVDSRKAVESLRDWIHKNIPSTPETTHVWPHQQPGTADATLQLENDKNVEAAFRTVFPAKHYDVRPIQGMNEIYVTAVGAKKSINSDAVFYTPHNDGPYWFLPGASCYRVLVGVTPNQMVRTRFNLQHVSQDQVLDIYGVVGFDYNRELHWIDHVPGAKNTERRSLVKLHYIVYPKGWHWYGGLCANLNQTYNTWARGNFLKTLRPTSMYEFVMAWWIWLTTWFNAIFEEYVGWSNLVYVAGAYALGPTPFLILTSFRHYAVYMTTFAYRQPMVAHGYLMRDAKFYKTTAIMHLTRRLWPMVDIKTDWPGLAIMAAGFGVTMLATARLGFVRTYFGSELGFVKPEWISGFPYGTIPHPMIVGQLFGYATLLYWFQDRISTANVALVAAHMTCYTLHMLQEMLTSSY